MAKGSPYLEFRAAQRLYLLSKDWVEKSSDCWTHAREEDAFTLPAAMCQEYCREQPGPEFQEAEKSYLFSSGWFLLHPDNWSHSREGDKIFTLPAACAAQRRHDEEHFN
jgi:hypothetical protein